MQVQIKFTATGSSQVTGNFAPGDLLRCSAEHARHLVDEARCAIYTDGPPAAAAEPGDDATAKPRQVRKSTQKGQA